MSDDLTRAVAEATEGKDREGTARWPECCRDTYSLAIEETAAAIAPLIEARVREATGNVLWNASNRVGMAIDSGALDGTDGGKVAKAIRAQTPDEFAEVCRG